MKKLLISALVLSSVSAMASTDDTINCVISAKLGSKTKRLQELPKKIRMSFDVISEGRNADIIGLQMATVERKWKKYGYGNELNELSPDAQDVLDVKRVSGYKDHDFWVNRYGVNHKAIQEYKVSLKRIDRDSVASLVKELGFDGEISSRANKSLKLNIDTEFTHKAQTKRVEFKEDGIFVNFTFSCLNKVKI